MITPKFTCTQDDESVTVSCYMPSIRASEVEIDVDRTHFSLYVHPYFLRLTFPQALIEDDDSYARYDPSSAFLNVKLTKEDKGVYFPDLDLLSRLLVPPASTSQNARGSDDGDISEGVTDSIQGLTLGGRKSSATLEVSSRPLIEVLKSTDSKEESEDMRLERLKRERGIFLKAAANDWHYPAPEATEDPTITLSIKNQYGFLDAYSGFFKLSSQTGNDVNELGDLAETIAPSVRTEMRLAHEDEKWDEEYYIAEFVEDEEIQEIIKWKHPFDDPSQEIEFTDAERDKMLELPRKEYLPAPQQTTSLYLTLVSILFSYCYDLRTTQHEPTAESAWTIATLTPCMSALDVAGTTVLVRSYRRALAFPLYRNWLLCERLRKDVANILAAGQRAVTRALLEAKSILEHSDTYYVYSKMWMEDYCVWIQTGASDEALKKLSRDVTEVKISKSTIGWPLEELEEAVLDARRGEEPEADSDDE
ncbi:uncharacterized protein EI90DRAFT_3145046 [Cantharellus anzutake]|uniref:uncharacterized protein n=1 Tax=Cantharellus anzutake TaxID=1750568 RepID=UPI001902E9D4|nr:uncharacterized protein EI90DRAFT_3145046 [Cantharellus anzutake]KAF8334055.1 hypothetical protein EI90DRAFT_3145046 [Cantharellus anzutake]